MDGQIFKNVESNDRMAWVEMDMVQPPSTRKDTFNYIRLLNALSNLALNIPWMEHPQLPWVICSSVSPNEKVAELHC